MQNYKLVASNFANFKINAMESQSGQNQNQNQNTYQQQNKPWWQIRGEQAAANEELLNFDGYVAEPLTINVYLNKTIQFCQKIFNQAKGEGIKLLEHPSDEQVKSLKLYENDKFKYNTILTLAENMKVFGCQTVSAHLMRDFTKNFLINTQLKHFVADNGKALELHSSVLVPCTDGQLYVLNVIRDMSYTDYFIPINRFYAKPLLQYAEENIAHWAGTMTKVEKDKLFISVGFYARVLINLIINRNLNCNPRLVNSFFNTVNEIEKNGNLFLQPYVLGIVGHPERFGKDLESMGNSCFFLLYLISDDNCVNDCHKFTLDLWNTAKNLDLISWSKMDPKYWENFLKLAEAFPKSKIIFIDIDKLEPKNGDEVIDLGVKGRKSIENLKPDGKIVKKIISLEEFLNIGGKNDTELGKLLKSGNYNFS
ncbi:MAG: hypothetical protein J6P21_00040 [Clostridia bacterium]|nr:hypothetical protein [Clostridia bacterium]